MRAEGVLLGDVAKQFGTPCYVYSQNAITGNYARLVGAFPKSKPSFRFAVKANGNLAVLKLLAEQGAGFDIVSGGELARVIAAGGDVGAVVFSGVGKSEGEIAQALEVGVGGFNVESASELKRVESVAKAKGKKAVVSLRVNPAIDGGAHPHLATGLGDSKFGVNASEVNDLAKYAAASSSLDFAGLSCHLGSQIRDVSAFAAAAAEVGKLCGQLRAQGIAVTVVDMGGGFAVDYEGEGLEVDYGEYDAALAEHFSDVELLLEPGRSVCADAGVLLCRVEYEKQCGGKLYWIADAGMNDLLRPALYSAAHRVAAVNGKSDTSERTGDVAGPVCESADIIARDCALQIKEGDLIAVLDAGAYGMTMASNYNARPRPCEVMVDGDAAFLIRRRESVEDLFAAEFGLL